MRSIYFLFLLLNFFTGEIAFSQEIKNKLILETRIFPDATTNEIEHRENLSVAYEPTLTLDSLSKKTDFTFTPFARFDQQDASRSHLDVRELNLKGKEDSFEYLIGISRVTWGLCASFHIVDFINQLDFIEHPVWQPKMGQQMVNLKEHFGNHGVELFILPGFRERTFVGREGRLRFTPRIDVSQTSYESGAEDNHTDFATQYFYKTDSVDFGIYHFWGTSRDPTLNKSVDSDGKEVFAPYYPLVHQTATHLKADIDDTNTLKFEGVHRIGQGDVFNATISGFEHNFRQAFYSNYDLHLLMEYHYSDSKSAGALTPFENDLFIGGILFLNDKGKTWIGAGEIYDMNSPAQSIVILLHSQLTDSLKLATEYRGLAKLPDTDPVYSIRRDGFFQAELIYTF